MKILFHLPAKESIYAIRTIYNGYKNAFIDLGHQFETLSSYDNFKSAFENFEPDVFFTVLHSFYNKFIDFNLLKEYKKSGLRVFVNTPFWNSPISRRRINESPSLSRCDKFKKLIISGDYGDIFYNSCECGDERMDGFESETGYKHYCIPLAADRIDLVNGIFSHRFKADISYIGSNLPGKRKFMRENVFSLSKIYDLKIYGQDWTLKDYFMGWVQRGGQYFNMHSLSSIRKPKLTIRDEADIYKSSKISINVHEDFQKEFGGDCNERTFKIPLCGGFEITDNVRCIKKYFSENKEIIIAENSNDWHDKINYYMKNDDKRKKIISAGMQRVLNDHTYHNRVNSLLDTLKHV